ncbi:MAG: Global nitrogen regulator NrpRII [ANME-2 cluster archaeon]|nr:Global nitrogen regulator NrpRII [ANME-2 cluster archaeon]
MAVKTLRKMNGGQIVFTLSNIEDLIYGVTFDPSSGSGRIVTNISLIDRDDVDNILPIFRDVMLSGLTVSPLAKMLSPGESVNDFIIPDSKCGIATVCSITVDGILLKRGIPVKPRFGGLVEVKDGNPVRFTDLVRYDSTTIDPLEILMSQSLTSVTGMLTIGSGKILANLREITMNARDRVEETLDDMAAVGLGGILEVGEPNTDVLGVSVERDHFGVVVAGGTNPMAVAQEQGFRIDTHAMSSLMDVGDMVPIDRLV